MFIPSSAPLSLACSSNFCLVLLCALFVSGYELTPKLVLFVLGVFCPLRVRVLQTSSFTRKQMQVLPWTFYISVCGVPVVMYLSHEFMLRWLVSVHPMRVCVHPMRHRLCNESKID